MILDTSTSLDRGKLFTSFGSIRVKVIEAIDCLDGLPSVDKRHNTVSYNIYVKIVIAKEDGEPLMNFSTATSTYTSGVLDICAEEYAFDGISSSNNIIASLYAANPTMDNKCIGLVVIPVSRLEENITVSVFTLNKPLFISSLEHTMVPTQ